MLSRSFKGRLVVFGTSLALIVLVATGVMARAAVRTGKVEAPVAAHQGVPAQHEILSQEQIEAVAAFTPGSPVHPVKLKQLKEAGLSESDVYTALSLQENTGVHFDRWVELRAAGLTWEQAIGQLHGDKPIPLHPASPDWKPLTEAELTRWAKEGYSDSDILTASEVAYRYGGDLAVLLAEKKAGKSWDKIREAEHVRHAKAKGAVAAIDDFTLGDDGKAEATSSGLTKAQIRQFMAKGYSLPDVMRADGYAHAFGLKLSDMLPNVTSGQDLMEHVRKAREARAKNGGN